MAHNFAEREEILREHYKSLYPGEFDRLNRKDLEDWAKLVFDEELARRMSPEWRDMQRAKEAQENERLARYENPDMRQPHHYLTRQETSMNKDSLLLDLKSANPLERKNAAEYLGCDIDRRAIRPLFEALMNWDEEEDTLNRGIYLTPPDTAGCGLTSVANGTGPTCTAC
jgi:hypothetical protein